MKNIIKRIIGKKLSRFLIFQKNKEYIPFTFKSFIDPENQYSDFFVYDTKIHKNYFIAENVFSLLNKEKLDVEHKFNFYSKDGVFLFSKCFINNNYLSKFELPKFKNQENYISYTHQSFSYYE